jgi:hypothetical protein
MQVELSELEALTAQLSLIRDLATTEDRDRKMTLGLEREEWAEVKDMFEKSLVRLEELTPALDKELGDNLTGKEPLLPGRVLLGVIRKVWAAAQPQAHH